MKKFLITFFDVLGIVHFQVLSRGQIVKQAHYVEILKRLREAVRRKSPELWLNDWILHHDNAPAHKALSVTQFLAHKSITKMENPLRSPDLALNDFWLFQKNRVCIKGRRFQDIEDIQKM
jgi:hypothetical protein